MLSDDENIVDIQFEVQYRIKDDGAAITCSTARIRPRRCSRRRSPRCAKWSDARRWTRCCTNRGRRSPIEVRKRMQAMLDRYGTGILVQAVAIQNAQPPEQVQAAFDDAVKAGQDRERQINEGQAYANDVIPKARGLASRLMQEAEGYRTRVVQTAEGDASRFKQILTEYQKAPAVTRDRMYLDTMQQVFTNSSKVMVDSRNNNQLLYLPLDKLVQQAGSAANDCATCRRLRRPCRRSRRPRMTAHPRDDAQP